MSRYHPLIVTAADRGARSGAHGLPVAADTMSAGGAIAA